MSSLPKEEHLQNLTIEGFLRILGSDAPVPGGGAAAALAGAMAAALVAMVARLTVGRERYAAFQDEMAAVRDRADVLASTLAAQVDADTAAYAAVLAAYRLPKEDEAQRTQRSAAVQKALVSAAQAPLAVAEACHEVLQLVVRVAAHGNRNAASDAAVAALLAQAALQGAVRNVQINLLSIRDEAFRASAATRIAELLAASRPLAEQALAAADAGA